MFNLVNSSWLGFSNLSFFNTVLVSWVFHSLINQTNKNSFLGYLLGSSVATVHGPGHLGKVEGQEVQVVALAGALRLLDSHALKET